MIVHPASGFHYVNVFPKNIVFDEIFACYRASSQWNPWMSAVQEDPRNLPVDDPSAFIVFWQALPEILNRPTAAKKALRYTESMNVDPSRPENQKRHFEHFEAAARNVDCVIAHTPTAVGILEKYAKHVILVPIGYESSVYGVPDWTVTKTADIGFYGSMVGKRGAVIEAMAERFGRRLRTFNSFGWARKADLDRCRMTLYVGHCEDPSFATTRLWQAVAGSAALATEGRDAWPAFPDRHYVRLPKADPGNMGPFLDSLERALAGNLEAVAQTAHIELSKFTVKECMESYLIPSAGVR